MKQKNSVVRTLAPCSANKTIMSSPTSSSERVIAKCRADVLSLKILFSRYTFGFAPFSNKILTACGFPV